MNDEKEKWQADPTKGREFLEQRRSEIVNSLEEAANIAYAALDEKLIFEIEQLKKASGDKKASILKSVSAAREKPVMEIVRKYWNEDKETMWRHFVHNMSESGKP